LSLLYLDYDTLDKTNFYPKLIGDLSKTHSHNVQGELCNNSIFPRNIDKIKFTFYNNSKQIGDLQLDSSLSIFPEKCVQVMGTYEGNFTHMTYPVRIMNNFHTSNPNNEEPNNSIIVESLMESHLLNIFPIRYIYEYETISIIDDSKSNKIKIQNEQDALKKREDLIHYIWRNTDFPSSKMPSNVQKNITDKNFDNIKNLKEINKITFSMEFGINSTAYHFIPVEQKNKLIIYHQGHDGDFVKGKNTIEYFLDKGFSVMAFSMPLTGNNNQPEVYVENFGKLKLINHYSLQFLENPGFSSIKFFVEPIIVSINYFEKNYNYESISMIGLSGGGWTTVISSAIDNRIHDSYPVAGSWPIYLRIESDSGSRGDYEQSTPGLYNTVNYPELYVLGSFGDDRKQLQIFNKNDPCCFSGQSYLTYEKEVSEVIEILGKGKFGVFLDDTNKHHISNKSLQIILKNIENY
jgi:hypothetical protein